MLLSNESDIARFAEGTTITIVQCRNSATRSAEAATDAAGANCTAIRKPVPLSLTGIVACAGRVLGRKPCVGSNTQQLHKDVIIS